MGRAVFAWRGDTSSAIRNALPVLNTAGEREGQIVCLSAGEGGVGGLGVGGWHMVHLCIFQSYILYVQQSETALSHCLSFHGDFKTIVDQLLRVS